MIVLTLSDDDNSRTGTHMEPVSVPLFTGRHWTSRRPGSIGQPVPRPALKAAYFLVLVLIFLSTAETSHAQTSDTPDSLGSVEAVDDVPVLDLVEVNWFEEALEGGMTMIALAALSIALVAFIAERSAAVREKNIAPPELAATVRQSIERKQFAEGLKAAESSDSALGRVLAYVIARRNRTTDRVSEGAGELAGMELSDHEQKLAPLAAVAALAPLLGLLGTMIGMIESFKLVEVFGDEGGASLMAGAISKALITTAAGLVIAIPAIVTFYFFKHRLHAMTIRLEKETNQIIELLFDEPILGADQLDSEGK